VELAEELRRNLGITSEIVSADAMQLYKDIDVLSAKASIEEQARVKHHLLSILNVDDFEFSVATYQRLAKDLVETLFSSQICPILVGGTNYYIESVIWKDKYMFEIDVSTIPEEIRAEMDKMSDSELHARLRSVDPERAELLHQNARRKVLRSLEIFYATYKPHSTWIKEQKAKAVLAFSRICFFWVSCETTTLDERLNRRVDDMVLIGLKDELKTISNRFQGRIEQIDWSRGAFQSIGLREFQPWITTYHNTGIDDTSMFDSALLDVKTHSRQYARSQISWIKNEILPHSVVYKLDSTDPSLWKQRVLQPAFAIASFLLKGGALENAGSIFNSGASPPFILLCPPPLKGEASEIPWKKHFCEYCNRTLNGDVEWQAHQRSKGHKAARRKFFKPSKASSPTAASSSNAQ
jgi:tRNA dimethylallyltransferase